MPKKEIEKIEKFYEKKGVAPKKAKDIAYATVNKQGKLDKKRRKASRKRK